MSDFNVAQLNRMQPLGLAMVFGLAVLVGMAIATDPMNAIAVVIGLALTMAGLLRPSLLVLLSLAFGCIDFSFITGNKKDLFASFGGIDFNGLKLVAITIGLLIFGTLRGYFRNPPLKSYIIFLVICLASLTYSVTPLMGLRTFFKLCLPYLFFLTIRHECRDPRFAASVDSAIMIAVVLVAGLSLLIWMTGHGFEYAENQELEYGIEERFARRFVGPTGGWANQASFSMIAGLYLYVKYFVHRHINYLLLFLVTIVLLFVTLARTEIATFAIAFFLMNILLKRRLLAVAAVLSVLVFSVVYTPMRQRLFFSTKETVAEVLEPGAISEIHDSGRFEVWALNISHFLKSPLIGNGLGVMETLLEGNIPHNEYLRLLAEVGIVGLAFWLWSYLVLLYWCWKQIRATDGPDRIPSVLALTALVSYLLLCITDNGIDWYSTVSQYVWALAAIGLYGRARPAETVQQS